MVDHYILTNMFRTSITRSARNITLPTRSLHSSPVAFKTVTESVKDTADDVFGYSSVVLDRCTHPFLA